MRTEESFDTLPLTAQIMRIAKESKSPITVYDVADVMRRVTGDQKQPIKKFRSALKALVLCGKLKEKTQKTHYGANTYTLP